MGNAAELRGAIPEAARRAWIEYARVLEYAWIQYVCHGYLGASRFRAARWGQTRSGLFTLISAALLGPLLAACAVGPDYVRAPARVPENYKELKDWKVATPIDAFDRGAWWSVYRDSRLDGLLRQVEVSNETVRAAAAAYEEARALIREAQSSLFPTLSGSYIFVRSFQGAGVPITGLQPGAGYTTVYSPQAAGSWAPDIWGKVRRQIESDVAAAQASAADLASARLSAQSVLAIAYFNLLATDSLRSVIDRSIAEYRRMLTLVQAQLPSGGVSLADVAAVQTQLLNAQTLLANTSLQRAQFEHAIAVLIGRPPAQLTIARRLLPEHVPAVPVTLPATLLERRPDVAAAERVMQAQNALIGAAFAGYFPNINLSGLAGFSGNVPLPFNVSNLIWALGAAGTEPVFNGGLTGAQVDVARATYWQSVSNYRQTVLTAFQQVEDQLAAIRFLTRQVRLASEAVRAARQSIETYTSQYEVGGVTVTTLVVAQSTLLTTEMSAVSVRQRLFVASVNLIEALGGGWDTALLPSADELTRNISLLPQLPPDP